MENDDPRRDGKPFSVYVAASAAPSELLRVKAAIAQLRAQGFAVTCTWPSVVERVGDANPRTASQADRRGWSVQDLAEVDAAHALWFLVPTPPLTTRGGWGEFLYAYSHDKHLVSSGDTKQSIFCALGHETETDAGGIAVLHKLRVQAGLVEFRDTTAPHDWPGPADFDLGDEI